MAFKIKYQTVVYHVETDLIAREFDRPDQAKHFIKCLKDSGAFHYGIELDAGRKEFDPVKFQHVKDTLKLAIETYVSPKLLWITTKLGEKYKGELEPINDTYGILQLRQLAYKRDKPALDGKWTLVHIPSFWCIGVGTKNEIKALFKIFDHEYIGDGVFVSG